jgi:signal transduction histidine kinase
MYQENGNIITAIHDQGVGIPENFKSKIFDSAGRGSSGTSGETSFGLGLSISQQIISLHNGRIWFDSKAGEGTSFYVSLPLVSN